MYLTMSRVVSMHLLQIFNHMLQDLDTGKLFSWLKKNDAAYIQLSKYEMNSYHSHICYISSGLILYSIHVHTS